jgi:ERCC4-type nuclease
VDDQKVRGSDIAAQLSELDGVPITVKRLCTWGYLIEGKTDFEQKRVPNFLKSLLGGRTFTFARRLADISMGAFLVP